MSPGAAQASAAKPPNRCNGMVGLVLIQIPRRVFCRSPESESTNQIRVRKPLTRSLLSSGSTPFAHWARWVRSWTNLRSGMSWLLSIRTIVFPLPHPRQLLRFAHPRRGKRKIPSAKRKVNAGAFKSKTPSTASRTRGRFGWFDASPLAVAPQTGSRMDAREISTRCACLFTPIFPSIIPFIDRP